MVPLYQLCLHPLAFDILRWGLGEGSVGVVFAVQAWGPEFESHAHEKMEDIGTP